MLLRRPNAPTLATATSSRWPRTLLAVAIAVYASVPAYAQVLHRNLAELTTLAPDIVVGTVVSVEDGIDDNRLPFTEVTVEVSRTVKGNLGGTYRFRQFGMQRPRVDASGMTNVMLTPAGWPRYGAGEEVMLFLYQPASATGLRTTVGLEQGKFTIRDGKIANASDNIGLLDRVALPTTRARRSGNVLRQRGAADAQAFIDLVETAVREKWFEGSQ